MQFTVWSRSHLTNYIGWHKGGPCSIIQFHRTLIMKATIEFLLLLLLGEVGAIVAPTYTFKFTIIAFLPFYYYFLFIYLFISVF
jgi:hypothetical protein